MQRQGGKVRNLGGEPFGLIAAPDVRKATIRLDLRACHDPSQHHVAGFAHAIPILSFEKPAGRFASVGGLGLVTSKKNTGQKKHI